MYTAVKSETMNAALTGYKYDDKYSVKLLSDENGWAIKFGRNFSKESTMHHEGILQKVYQECVTRKYHGMYSFCAELLCSFEL